MSLVGNPESPKLLFNKSNLTKENTMQITMQSTSEIVTVQGVPCRTWLIETIDGVKPEMESFVYTRMLAIDPDIIVDDPNVYLLDGPNPPSVDEVQIHKEVD